MKLRLEEMKVVPSKELVSKIQFGLVPSLTAIYCILSSVSECGG